MKLETKVGLFVFLGILSLFVLATRIQTVFYIGKKGYEINLELSDASGLEINSKVKNNGVSIGYVKSIYLSKNKAMANLFIFEDKVIPVGSTAILTQESLLGGKYINIIPSTSDVVLKQGEKIESCQSLASINETSQKIFEAADTFKILLEKLNRAIDEEEIQNFKDTIREFKQMGREINKKMPKIMAQIDSLTYEFDKIAKSGSKEIPQILQNINDLTADIKEITEFSKDDINSTLKSAKAFFSKSTKTVQKIQNILDSINKAELKLDIKTQNMLRDNYYKTYFGGSYRPNPYDYYILQGVTTNKINEKDPITNNFILPSKHKSSDILLSAQLGKRYNNLLFRLGIIESTGGTGVDYFLLDDRLRLAFDLYDFNAVNDIRGEQAHLNFSFSFTPIRHLYLYGGFDNVLNKNAQNAFVGAGVEFIDDNFKNIAISSGTLKSIK